MSMVVLRIRLDTQVIALDLNALAAKGASKITSLDLNSQRNTGTGADISVSALISEGVAVISILRASLEVLCPTL
jgi:hypothetical protein